MPKSYEHFVYLQCLTLEHIWLNNIVNENKYYGTKAKKDDDNLN